MGCRHWAFDVSMAPVWETAFEYAHYARKSQIIAGVKTSMSAVKPRSPANYFQVLFQ